MISPEKVYLVSKSHPLNGRTAVLATKHQKGALIAPIMESVIGMRVTEAEVDTDVLGTFAGEIQRQNGQLETALHKARLGLEWSGATLGLASEGSIGADPILPFTVDLEIVAFVNIEENYEVWELNRSPDIIAKSICVRESDDLDAFLKSADFPNHGVIVRPSDDVYSLVHKGIHNYETLKKSIAEVANVSADSRVIIETDLRAHHCPSRRINIERASSKLANRLKELCPSCLTPGWGVVQMKRGLSCDWCGSKTSRIREQVFGCVACEHEQAQPVAAGLTADPKWCERCNP